MMKMNEKQGIYSQAEELGLKDKRKMGHYDSIYSEAEELGNQSKMEIHDFMAAAWVLPLELELKLRPVGEHHIYEMATKYGQKDRTLGLDQTLIYRQAEELSEKSKDVIHEFMTKHKR